MRVIKFLCTTGLLRKKECWRFTWQGWLALLILLSAAAAAVVFSLFPFLAVDHPIQGQILIVEGWVPDYSLKEVKSIFEKNEYQLLVITGNPLPKGEVLSEYKTFPELTKAILIKTGWDPKKIVTVSSTEVLRDRTYSAALAFRQWNSDPARKFSRVDIYTGGAHARRTRLLYQLALAGQTEVGIIAGRDERYDGRRWWRSSEGFRTVLDEAIAYIYAKLLFSPE